MRTPNIEAFLAKRGVKASATWVEAHWQVETNAPDKVKRLLPPHLEVTCVPRRSLWQRFRATINTGGLYERIRRR